MEAEDESALDSRPATDRRGSDDLSGLIIVGGVRSNGQRLPLASFTYKLFDIRTKVNKTFTLTPRSPFLFWDGLTWFVDAKAKQIWMARTNDRYYPQQFTVVDLFSGNRTTGAPVAFRLENCSFFGRASDPNSMLTSTGQRRLYSVSSYTPNMNGLEGFFDPSKNRNGLTLNYLSPMPDVARLSIIIDRPFANNEPFIVPTSMAAFPQLDRFAYIDARRNCANISVVSSVAGISHHYTCGFDSVQLASNPTTNDLMIYANQLQFSQRCFGHMTVAKPVANFTIDGCVKANLAYPTFSTTYQSWIAFDVTKANWVMIRAYTNQPELVVIFPGPVQLPIYESMASRSLFLPNLELPL